MANDIDRLLAVARGEAPADLVLTGGRIVNVFTGETLGGQIAICGRLIAGVGAGYHGAQTIDLDGAFVAPGLIDAHVHAESAMVPPHEFARAVVPRGVTTVVTDPHEIANVLGLPGIRYMIEDAAGAPFSMIVNASSCVPATAMETSGASVGAADLAGLLDDPSVLGLAEVMNFPGVIHRDPEVLAKLHTFRGRVIDGHCPGLSGQDLCAYIAAGPSSDHEATTPEEALEKLRLGMHVFLREATNARNLLTLLPAITPENARRASLCTDDRQPADLLAEGSVDHLVRLAIGAGVPPITALRMATLNTSEHFRLGDRGGIAPGRLADMFVFSDMEALVAEIVVRHGEVVARGGRLVVPSVGADPAATRGSVTVDWSRVALRIPATGSRMRVIGVVPDQLITRHMIEPAHVVAGYAEADPARDILKMAVIERHGRNGNVGLGFVHGVGLKEGAIAGTVAHDHHNLIVIGADDVSMLAAARAVADAGGGLAAARGEDVIAALSLPIAGLMSEAPIEVVRDEMAVLIDVARGLGSSLHDPFMAMSFLALEVIPSLKLTDIGLVDVDAFQPVALFV